MDLFGQHLIIYYCFLLLSHAILSGSCQEESIMHSVFKRMNIESCLGKFDVKSDMIIRTEESRQLGGKFLDTTDVGSQEECLRLCCETDNCDVFVFEEKDQGTCYLFHCGPAQNFRCKFINHVNYTSAVFSPEKKVAAPPTTASNKVAAAVHAPAITLSQHEMELKNLKSKATVRLYGPSVNGKVIVSDVTTTTTSRAISAPLTNANTSHCSRFQFQCHSGDCIAVYNACDGIPQCDDGSDEGPECQSIARTTEHAPKKSPSAYGQGKLSGTNLQIDTNPQSYVGHNREDPFTAPQWPILNQPQNNDDAHPFAPDMSGGHIFNHKGGLHVPDNIALPQQSQQQQQPQQTLTNQYQLPQYPLSPYNLAAAPKDAYTKSSSIDTYPRSWNNAGDPNLLSNWPQQMPQFPLKPMDPIEQQKQPLFTQYQPDLLAQESAAASQSQQQQQLQQQQFNWPIFGPNLPTLPNSNNINANNEEIIPQKEGIGAIKDAPVSDRKKDGKNTMIQGKNDSTSTEDKDSEYNNEENDEQPTEAPKKKKKHKKLNKIDKSKNEAVVRGESKFDNNAATTDSDSAVVQQRKLVHSSLQLEFMDHDGEADRPGGAVVSLALGILITIALILMIGCRTTAVRKRVRRGGKNYAHDADFLVNGMYL